MSLRDEVEYLAIAGFMDETRLNAGNVEHLLHEFCHVVTLNDESLVGPDLEFNIQNAFKFMTGHESDWNEIKTIACELVVLQDESMGYLNFTAFEIAGNADFYMPRGEAVSHAVRLSKSKVAAKRAEKVKDLIHRTYEVAVQEDEANQ